MEDFETNDLKARYDGTHLNPSTQKVEAGESWIWGQFGLYNESQASLGHIGRPCFRKEGRERGRKKKEKKESDD
jgi:hypothetical protein